MIHWSGWPVLTNSKRPKAEMVENVGLHALLLPWPFHDKSSCCYSSVNNVALCAHDSFQWNAWSKVNSAKNLFLNNKLFFTTHTSKTRVGMFCLCIIHYFQENKPCTRNYSCQFVKQRYRDYCNHELSKRLYSANSLAMNCVECLRCSWPVGIKRPCFTYQQLFKDKGLIWNEKSTYLCALRTRN